MSQLPTIQERAKQAAAACLVNPYDMESKCAASFRETINTTLELAAAIADEHAQPVNGLSIVSRLELGQSIAAAIRALKE